MKTNNSFIIHVNADYPEEVDFAFKIAIEYRMKFKRDVVVDISGYRKYGHNEQDMPKFTQPKMYQRVEKKESMWKMYSKRLVDEGTFTQEEIDQLYQKKIDRLEEAFEKAKTENFNPKEWDSTVWGTMLSTHSNSGAKAFNTNISEHDFKLIGKKITTLPTGKDFHSIIVKNYEQRLKSIESGQNIDWATAEALAFGSLLTEGFGVRLSGEDVRRGTFSHRHAALVDQKDGSRYYPLRQLVDRDEEIKMQVYNSLLSEYGVLGFDYGYSIGAPNYLTLWEAQFGDFVNVAQPIIDQYISSAERKWGVRSGLVMLLPHGFDGQGPEHSSARVERFLQLIDDDPYDTRFIEGTSAKQAKMANMSVVNITEPANYFHCLRRQIVNSDFRKPLIVLSPKKLLRLKAAQSNIEDFTNTKHFQKVLPEPKPQDIDAPDKVKQVIFCSGQLFYDLINRREELKQKVILHL